MTKLLISVRNAAEAQIAIAGGADLIDVKEPTRGSLGAADLASIEAVVRQVAGRVPLSAALGELLLGSSLPAAFSGRLQFAKFGLSGCSLQADWPARWQQAISQLPRGVTPVAVAYADWQGAFAPDPWQVLAHAKQVGCGAMLLDTFDKSQGSLMQHCTTVELTQLFITVQRNGLQCVVAGSLGLGEIAQLLPLAPDYVAVRGAACIGDRTGRLHAERVRHLAAVVHSAKRLELTTGL